MANNVILDSSLNGSATINDITMDNEYSEEGIITGHIHPISIRSGMSVIEMIQHSGPDFMTNKFDVYFLWDPLEADTKSDNLDTLSDQMSMSNITPIEKYFLNHRGFAVRSGKIEVPAIINQDYSIPFLETNIHKIRSNKTNNNESKISFRLDQDLIWLSELQLLSGRQLVLDNSIISSNDNNDFVRIGKNNKTIDRSITLRDNWQSVFSCISKTWPTRSKGDSYTLKNTGLCIIVKMEHLGNIINLNYQQKVLPYIVFENVKMLGTSDKIGYSRESPEIQEINMSFIFKRSYELLPTVNVRNNTSGKSFEKTLNRDGIDDDINFKKGWQIPIYDNDDQYNDMVTAQNSYFILNR